ncbi:Zn-dependent hydrolase [Acidobacteriota bacterium]
MKARFQPLLFLTFWGSVLVFTAFLYAKGGTGQMKDLKINPGRLNNRILELAEYGKTHEGGVNRVAFSKEDKDSRKYLIELMNEAGLDVRIDAAANIIGRREGRIPGLPPILLGSHTDTVPHGGKYDGALGVLSAIECAQVIYENGIQTRHPLEIVVFTDEEGGLAGSRAMTGTLTSDALDVVSHSGKTVGEGIRYLGGDPDAIQEVARQTGDIEAFLEIHIEQGQKLEKEGIDIGVVEGIVGINWWDVLVEGSANHAGTTPMDMRKDALLTAAHFIIAVNRIVKSFPGSQVGTVGRIEAEPGAPNVIPGRVLLSLEIRDLSSEKIRSIFKKIEKEAAVLSSQTGTPISFSPIDAMAVPAPTDPAIRQVIAETAQQLGLSYKFMPSGAGHDAQDMAKISPTGMIFIPSVGGISHSPREFSKKKDCTNGANILLQSFLKIDQTSSR